MHGCHARRRRQAGRSAGHAGARYQERHARRGCGKGEGNITWVAVADAVPVEVRLYERLFAIPQPGSGEMLDELNRESLVTCAAFAEPSLAVAKFGGAAFQFERHGYFVVDAKAADDGTLVFNRAAGMRDSREK